MTHLVIHRPRARRIGRLAENPAAQAVVAGTSVLGLWYEHRLRGVAGWLAVALVTVGLGTGINALIVMLAAGWTWVAKERGTKRVFLNEPVNSFTASSGFMEPSAAFRKVKDPHNLNLTATGVAKPA
jgi:hypothetical protein